MTAKYFGEFLVEKNVITQENLVDALIEQISATPPICQVVFQKRILPTSSIFDAFRYQQDNQVEFVQACKMLGIWTAEVQAKANSALEDLRKPLGQILISKGIIDLKKLTNMLDEFLSQISYQETVVKKESQPSVESKPEPVKTELTPEPLPTTFEEEFQDGIIMELEETYDERKRKMTRVALSLVKDNAGGDQAICAKLIQDVFKIVHSLNGLLGLLALEKLSEMLTAIEGYLTNLQAKVSSISKDELIQSIDEVLKALDLCWNLRLSIIEFKTEKAFLANPVNQKTFDELVNKFKG